MDSSTLLKRLFLGLTVLFFLAGFFFIVFAMIVPTPHGSFLTMNARAFPLGMGLRIGMIILLIIITVLCVVAMTKDNNRLIAVMSVLLVIMLLVELILSLKYLSWRTRVSVSKNDFAAGPAMLLHYGFDEGITSAFDVIQRTQACCGVNDFRDWYYTPWAVKNGKGNSVPTSCCNIPVPGCGDNMDLKNPIDTVHLMGCTGLKYFNTYKERIFNGAAIGLIIVHVMATFMVVIFACLYNNAEGLSFTEAMKGQAGSPTDSKPSGGKKSAQAKGTDKKPSKSSKGKSPGGRNDPGKYGKGDKDKAKKSEDKYEEAEDELLIADSDDYLLDKSKKK